MDEMRDAVHQVLAERGVLGQLRAQVRAAVFTAVDEEERKQGVRMDNPRLQQLVRSPEGPYLVGLLEDFLSYYGMAFTRSTLESEASMTDDRPRRQDVARWAGIAGSAPEDRPLLVSLVQAARSGAASGSPKTGGTAAPAGSSGIASLSRFRMGTDNVSDEPGSPGGVRSPQSPAEGSASASFISEGGAGGPDSPTEAAGLGSTVRPGQPSHSSFASLASSSRIPHSAAYGSQSDDAGSTSASPESLRRAVSLAAGGGGGDGGGADGSRERASASPVFAIGAAGADVDQESARASPPSGALGSAARSGSGAAAPSGRSRTGELGIQIDLSRAGAAVGSAGDSAEPSSAEPSSAASRDSEGTSGADPASKASRDADDEEIARFLAEAATDGEDLDDSLLGGTAAGSARVGGDAAATRTGGGGAAWGAGRGAPVPAEPPAAPKGGDSPAEQPSGAGLSSSRSAAELPPLPGVRGARAAPPAVPGADGAVQPADHTVADDVPEVDDEPEASEVSDDYADNLEDDFISMDDEGADGQSDDEAQAAGPQGAAGGAGAQQAGQPPARSSASGQDDDLFEVDDEELDAEVDGNRSPPASPQPAGGRSYAAAAMQAVDPPAASGAAAVVDDVEEMDDVGFDAEGMDDGLDDIGDGHDLEADLEAGDAGDLSLGDSRSLDRSFGHAAAPAARASDVVDTSFVAGDASGDDLDFDNVEFDAMENF
ncbi:hypothetical protein FNF27_06623 [Cafeteria roenbergensis]|uniref:FGFR1 oncogene partner (FOP) N-terminal dimerisation domain-containing protein n=1 Tax=Cafeteria roenbergensis TaxID=33653 RepID=A0A5A8DY25_CAFRO|nr:hypothetical protein FNF27_06623 [Cafeteria roenbergensis]|mmetsp:Transcript_4583/g.19520  ORF Transcript_4583/g.19520 Transcript_4583/m.19520 type:complete len:715 (-) Transcript_4583:137-2281(-)